MKRSAPEHRHAAMLDERRGPVNERAGQAARAAHRAAWARGLQSGRAIHLRRGSMKRSITCVGLDCGLGRADRARGSAARTRAAGAVADDRAPPTFESNVPPPAAARATPPAGQTPQARSRRRRAPPLPPAGPGQPRRATPPGARRPGRAAGGHGRRRTSGSSATRWPAAPGLHVEDVQNGVAIVMSPRRATTHDGARRGAQLHARCASPDLAGGERRDVSPPAAERAAMCSGAACPDRESPRSNAPEVRDLRAPRAIR